MKVHYLNYDDSCISVYMSKFIRSYILDTCCLKTDTRGTVIKTAWHGHRKSHANQWKRLEDPEVNPDS
jgi:hypothetical protein